MISRYVIPTWQALITFVRINEQYTHTTSIGRRSFSFLVDRTNGLAYATVLRMSVNVVVVCEVMYCG